MSNEAQELILEDSGKEAQLLSKVIQDGSLNILTRNGIDEKYFVKYKSIYQFIVEHHKKYKQVPDSSTIVLNFEDFYPFEVNASEEYLIDSIVELHTYRETCIVVKQMESILKEDSHTAVNFLMTKIPELSKAGRIETLDLLAECESRFDTYIEMKDNSGDLVVPTGFIELDDITAGWMKDDLAFLMARPNQGKSWILDKYALSAYESGRKVGIYSGEMSDTLVGYRIDTLRSNISNTCLLRGNAIIESQYREYIELTKKLQGLEIVTQQQFGGKPTCSNLRSFIEKENLDILFVDQLSLVKDQQKRGGQQRYVDYENICQDLLSIVMEYKVPIICAVQASRESTKEEDKMPKLEHVSGADAIGQVATKLIGIYQDRDKGHLIKQVVKNRNFALGPRLIYDWNIDKGIFSFNTDGDSEDGAPMKKPIRSKRNQGKQVF